MAVCALAVSRSAFSLSAVVLPAVVIVGHTLWFLNGLTRVHFPDGIVVGALSSGSSVDVGSDDFDRLIGSTAAPHLFEQRQERAGRQR